jgi:endonuclease I
MKFFFTFISLLVFNFSWSQIPTGYYNTATGSGYTLKTQLHNIIDDHNDQGYSALWDLYTSSAFRDNWYENNGSLLDIYSEKPTGNDSYEYTSTTEQCGSYSTEGDCYNREHLYPQGFFNEASPMKNDAHFVVPSDGKVNGQRNNFPFGKVATATWTFTNGSKLGPNLNSGYSAGYTGTVFEPIDEFKGDVARALFYVATRYEDVITSWESFEMVNGTTDQVFTNTFKNILLTWNTLDPVSSYEIAKNNEIYYNHQNNRNPFIDHPEWVTSIWGTVVGVEEESISFCKIYPNPAHDVIIVESNDASVIQGYTIFSMLGEEIQSGSFMQSNSISVENIATGMYWLQVNTDTSASIEKIIIQ